MNLYNKDLLSTQDWSKEELLMVLKLAEKMKRNRFSEKYTQLLKNKTFLMLFYDASLRTRMSFETAMTELGGNTQLLNPATMRLTGSFFKESIQDVANVMSRYGCGIGMRIHEDSISQYGDGHQLLREFAKYADVPIVNMGDDKGL